MTPSPTKNLPIAVLISGSGRTLQNFLQQIDAGQLNIDIRQVVSSRSEAGGLDHARKANVPTLVVKRGDYATAEEFSEALFAPCRDAGARYVVMAGFTKHVLIPDDFTNRVVNIHPALIPAYCGQGFYGHHVHEAVLADGAKTTGCTVHFVDNEYDHGPIILQRTVPVLDDDTPERLAQRVFEAELEAYPEVLRLLAAGRITTDGRSVQISDS